MKTLDASLLARCTDSTPERAEPYVKPLRLAMARFEIDTATRAAPLLANIGVETLYLRAVEENLRYTTADRLREIFPGLFRPPKGKHRAEDYTSNPAALSRLRFNGFHGRGLLHLTWEDAYRAAGEALGQDYVNNPAHVMRPDDAALTACWFWRDYKHLNPIADAWNLREIRRRVNGEAVLELAKTVSMAERNLALLRD